MSFDIHQLDNVNYSEDENAEEASRAYQDAILEQFFESPEGQARLQADPDMGFWARQLMYYGFTYIGITLPQMTVRTVREIVTELYPSKVSLNSPDDADDTIPELLAFWAFLKREYQLDEADAILDFMRKIEPEFKSIMNDPASFGMAKSFFTAGQDAGFDMTDPQDSQKFIQFYNARILNQLPELDPDMPPDPALAASLMSEPLETRGKKADPRKKRLRKLAKVSRKTNRRKRK